MTRVVSSSTLPRQCGTFYESIKVALLLRNTDNTNVLSLLFIECQEGWNDVCIDHDCKIGLLFAICLFNKKKKTIEQR